MEVLWGRGHLEGAVRRQRYRRDALGRVCGLLRI